MLSLTHINFDMDALLNKLIIPAEYNFTRTYLKILFNFIFQDINLKLLSSLSTVILVSGQYPPGQIPLDNCPRDYTPQTILSDI